MTGKSWKDAEVKGFAVELSDSDDDDHVAADSSDVVAGRQMPRQVGPQHQWELLAAAEHLGIAEEHVNAKEMQQVCVLLRLSVLLFTQQPLQKRACICCRITPVRHGAAVANSLVASLALIPSLCCRPISDSLRP